MKKLLIGLAVLVVLAGIVWSGLWYTGRGQIEDQLDLEIARLEANGTSVTWQDRRIDGFPFGYEVVADLVAITNLENGVLVRIPEVVSKADASDIDRIETSLIGEIQIDVPISEEMRESDPRLPRAVNIRMTGDDLRVAIEGLTDPEDQRYIATASELVLTIDQEDMPNGVDLSISGLNSTVTRLADAWTSGTQAGRFRFSVDGEQADGRQSEFEIDIGTLSVTSKADMSRSGDLNEILFGTVDGSVEIAYSMGSITSRATSFDSSGGGGKVQYSGSTGTGVIGVENGVMALQAESRKNAWTVEPSDDASAVRGTVEADVVQAGYRLPTVPADTPKPAGVSLSILGLDGDDTFWTSLDPGAVLDRSSSELVVDIEATAKVTGRLDQMSPTGRFPLVLSNISVNAMDLSALGGRVRASGDVEVLQPINLPLGALDIRMSNPNAVMDALKQAGLIDEPTWTAGTAMLRVYARPGEGEDNWETDVTFENDGITVNGLLVR